MLRWLFGESKKEKELRIKITYIKGRYEENFKKLMECRKELLECRKEKKRLEQEKYDLEPGPSAAATFNQCRNCGCTDDNACIQDNGEPCHWVEHDLCSKCVNEDRIQPFSDGKQVWDWMHVNCRRCRKNFSSGPAREFHCDIQHALFSLSATGFTVSRDIAERMGLQNDGKHYWQCPEIEWGSSQ